MYNTETLQTLFNHFNEDCEDRGETKETLARVIENLLTFYLARNPPEKEVKECKEKQLSLLDKEETFSPLLVEDRWQRAHHACHKYTFLCPSTISKLKKKMKMGSYKGFYKCFQYADRYGSLVPQVNVHELLKFILKHKEFAPGYHHRIKDLLKGKHICLSSTKS